MRSFSTRHCTKSGRGTLDRFNPGPASRATVSALLASVLLLDGGPVAKASAPSFSDAAAVSPERADWIDDLDEFVRKLFILIGGDPSTFDKIPQHEMAAVEAFYAAHGL